MTDPKHVVALSGGKDSTALALRLREVYPDRNFEFVYTPTGDELPPMQEHWARLRDLLGVVRSLPTLTLMELIRREKMLPNFRARFCTRVLKIEPFLEYMETCPPGSVMYVGIRADEEDRLGAIVDADDHFTVAKPFLEWRWGLPEVRNYLQCRQVEIPERTDCGACFYQRLPEWKALLEEYPERYQSYVDLEEEFGHTFRSPQRDTWPASLKDLREEFRSGRVLRARTSQKSDSAMCPWCSK